MPVGFVGCACARITKPRMVCLEEFSALCGVSHTRRGAEWRRTPVSFGTDSQTLAVISLSRRIPVPLSSRMLKASSVTQCDRQAGDTICLQPPDGENEASDVCG